MHDDKVAGAEAGHMGRDVEGKVFAPDRRRAGVRNSARPAALLGRVMLLAVAAVALTGVLSVASFALPEEQRAGALMGALVFVVAAVLAAAFVQQRNLAAQFGSFALVDGELYWVVLPPAWDPRRKMPFATIFSVLRDIKRAAETAARDDFVLEAVRRPEACRARVHRVVCVLELDERARAFKVRWRYVDAADPKGLERVEAHRLPYIYRGMGELLDVLRGRGDARR